MSKLSAYALFCLATALAAHAKIYFEENFSDDSWKSKWTYSENPGKEYSQLMRSSDALYNNVEVDKGTQTSQDYQFYALSRKFEPFTNDGKDLIVQFTIKHEQDIHCGGGYIKLFNCNLEPNQLHGETPYEIMFGLDMCGIITYRLLVIFNYNGKHFQINKEIYKRNDIFTQLYTLIVKPDNKYEILVDNVELDSGELEAGWNFLPSKEIMEPKIRKPEYRDKPKYISNPDFKGERKSKQIKNPDYKGEWVHPEIDNKPNYLLYQRKEICALSFDLWQVKFGTIFSNILITDDIEEAKKNSKVFWVPRYYGECKMKEALDEEEKKKAQETKMSDGEQKNFQKDKETFEYFVSILEESYQGFFKLIIFDF